MPARNSSAPRYCSSMRSTAAPFSYVRMSNIPSASCGERTGILDRAGARRARRSRVPRCDRDRTSPRRASRAASRRCTPSMNVAKASLSQMPFHHRIVTRSPNHMWAISWATTSAITCSSACVAVVGSTRRRALPERDAAEVLHRAEGEVGQGDEVELVARIRDAEVARRRTRVLNAPHLSRERGEVRPCRAGARRAAAFRRRRSGR